MRLRLDKLLVDRGFAASRERAAALIMEGKVLCGGLPVAKAGALVDSNAALELKGEDIRYVGRGGLKLEAALKHFGLSVTGLVAIDVGASTGGFTDCLLQHGADRVYAVDVGYGQISWKLRQDSRVVVIERENIRYLDPKRIPEPVDIAVIDVSFISLTTVMPHVLEFLKTNGEGVALIKPQFEAGKGEVGKGGILRDDNKRLAVTERVRLSLEGGGIRTVGMIESPIKGQKGNVEYLLYFKKL